MMNVSELEQLAKHWRELKLKQVELRETQLNVEERIKSLVGVKEEGSISATTDSFKVKTTGGLTRKLETNNYEELKASLGADEFNRLIRVKLDVNVKELKDSPSPVRDMLYSNMVIHPKKVSIQVEPREDI
tara:strand:- start:2420 stop:2812 length:393 start_codon:yes stop_codon:yes gene_type:complete